MTTKHYYVERPRRVEAIRFDPENAKGLFEFEPNAQLIYQGSLSGAVSVRLPGMSVGASVSPGYWIIRTDLGRFEFLSSERFAEYYEEAK